MLLVSLYPMWITSKTCRSSSLITPERIFIQYGSHKWEPYCINKGIIFPVPTPFYHIWLAQDLLDHPSLPQAARRSLVQHWGAFLFGNTAPDVQVVSGQDRAATHFFDIPVPVGAVEPWSVMFLDYPGLTSLLPSEQAAFIAVYVCHLLADWRWVLEIFAPAFGPGSHWENFGRRLYLHNVLRAYLDHQLVSQIGSQTSSALELVIPDGWLPFVQDHYLCQWRDLLYPQLRSGAAIATVEVFAARQQVEPDTYYRLLASEQRMDEEVFSHLPRQQLADFRQRLLDESAAILRLLNLR